MPPLAAVLRERIDCEGGCYHDIHARVPEGIEEGGECSFHVSRYQVLLEGSAEVAVGLPRRPSCRVTLSHGMAVPVLFCKLSVGF